MPLTDIKGLILDMDGVLWRGDQPLLDLPGFFETAARYQLQVVLATNNATKSVDQYLHKLAGYHVFLSGEQIVNSSMSAAFYLKGKYPQGGLVFVVGETGLVDTLSAWGFYQASPADHAVLAVVAGLDRTLTYPKLSRAHSLRRRVRGHKSRSHLPHPRRAGPRRRFCARFYRGRVRGQAGYHRKARTLHVQPRFGAYAAPTSPGPGNWRPPGYGHSWRPTGRLPHGRRAQRGIHARGNQHVAASSTSGVGKPGRFAPLD
jgi:hypothetical protein